MTTAHAITLPVSADASEGAPLPQAGNFVTTLTGIQISGDPSYEDWIKELDSMFYSDNAIQWAKGDLFLYGEEKFGEKFAQAVDTIRYNPQTLANIMYVCRAFPPSERRPNLVFSSHAECASLEGENRKLALDKLETGEWTRQDVRAYKKSLKGEPVKKTELVTLKPSAYRKRGKQLIVVFEDVPDNVIEWIARVSIPQAVTVSAEAKDAA
jgi:hypothetical protein